LPAPLGLSRNSIYISTEAPLSTTRLAQLLESHPRLCQLPAEERPSLSRVLAIPVQDIESQDHILAFQLPNAIRKYNVGLVVLDSVAANYRAEHGSTAPRDLATRAAQLAKLGKLLRDLAKEENIAVVIANQVSDRFEDLPLPPRNAGRQHSGAKPLSLPTSSSTPEAPVSSAGYSELAAQESSLTHDFQQRFFTGWGDETTGNSSEGLKTPALGLAWTNQIACRIALKMETWRPSANAHESTIITASSGGGNQIWQEGKKRRYLRLVFAPWTAATRDPVEYEIRPDGVAACKMRDDSNQT
jgi:DNA repair protein RAD57